MTVNKSRKIDFVKKHLLSYVFYKLRPKNFAYRDISNIIGEYQKLLADDISNGQPVKLANGLGSFQLSKIKRGVSVNDNGEVINNMPIDMIRTFEFWKEHPEFKGKKYIRFVNDHTNGYLFCLNFRLKSATFKLKSFYTFRKSRVLTKALSDNIKNGKVDAIIKDY